MTTLAQSQFTNPALGPRLKTMLTGTNPGVTFLDTILPNLITIGFIIGSLYFIFEFLLGAIHWISAEGDKAKAQSARDQLNHAFIGLIILFSTYAVIKLISLVFGVSILKINFAPLFL